VQRRTGVNGRFRRVRRPGHRSRCLGRLAARTRVAIEQDGSPGSATLPLSMRSWAANGHHRHGAFVSPRNETRNTVLGREGRDCIRSERRLVLPHSNPRGKQPVQQYDGADFPSARSGRHAGSTAGLGEAAHLKCSIRKEEQMRKKKLKTKWKKFNFLRVHLW